MPQKTLLQPTLDLVNQYLYLKFNGKTVRTPYFNNKRTRVRGALRVLVGKGSIIEIKEELKILSLREKVDLRNFSEEEITKFIINNNIGIDCSGLAYYILDTELKARGKKPLKKYLKFPHVTNPLRKLLIKLRPAENCDVKTLADNRNSIEINLKDIQPGDIIILLNAGLRHDYNHVMIITKIEHPTINYVHSFQYSEDGKYNHGVREEQIEIIDPNLPILKQHWKEEKMKEYIKTAEKITTKRLNVLQK